MPRTLALFAALAGLLPACSTTTCQTVAVDVSDLCIPLSLASDRQLVIEVREQCGRGCSSMPSCSAFLRNGQVFLDLAQDVCTDSTYGGCIALGCVRRVIRCTLPSLHVGDYPLLAPGSDLQLLRVRSDGQAACFFPPQGDGGV
jgi:hypothetical protein